MLLVIRWAWAPCWAWASWAWASSTWFPSKENDSVGTSVGPSEIVGPGDGIGPSVCVDGDYNIKALVANEPPVDHGIPMSQFEKLMINHMDTMTSDKKEHYKFL